MFENPGAFTNSMGVWESKLFVQTHERFFSGSIIFARFRDKVRENDFWGLLPCTQIKEFELNLVFLHPSIHSLCPPPQPICWLEHFQCRGWELDGKRPETGPSDIESIIKSLPRQPWEVHLFLPLILDIQWQMNLAIIVWRCDLTSFLVNLKIL